MLSVKFKTFNASELVIEEINLDGLLICYIFTNMWIRTIKRDREISQLFFEFLLNADGVCVCGAPVLQIPISICTYALHCVWSSLNSLLCAPRQCR